MAPLLVVVGGFLGAGKTTIVLGTVERLRRRGRRVAVITNDQGGSRVDTALRATVHVVEQTSTGQEGQTAQEAGADAHDYARIVRRVIRSRIVTGPGTAHPPLDRCMRAVPLVLLSR
jgi:Ni2+-binding GTPase involved in maturation of urease and hydrogenase